MRLNPFKAADETKAELKATKEQLESAEQRILEADARLIRLQAHRDARFRVGVLRINAPRLQADLRQKVPGIKLEGPQTEQVWTITADAPLPEADLNAVKTHLQAALEMDTS